MKTQYLEPLKAVLITLLPSTKIILAAELEGEQETL